MIGGNSISLGPRCPQFLCSGLDLCPQVDECGSILEVGLRDDRGRLRPVALLRSNSVSVTVTAADQEFASGNPIAFCWYGRVYPNVVVTSEYAFRRSAWTESFA